jgi:hypothetical protein
MRRDIQSADNTVWKFMLHCYDYALARGAQDGPVLPDDLMAEAEALFRWE